MCWYICFQCHYFLARHSEHGSRHLFLAHETAGNQSRVKKLETVPPPPRPSIKTVFTNIRIPNVYKRWSYLYHRTSYADKMALSYWDNPLAITVLRGQWQGNILNCQAIYNSRTVNMVNWQRKQLHIACMKCIYLAKWAWSHGWCVPISNRIIITF